MDNLNIICIVQSAFKSLSASLKSYGEAVDWRQRRPTKQFAADFTDQRLGFSQNALNLLSILLDDQVKMTSLDREQLVEDVESPEWNALAIDSRLRERYPEHQELILETFVEMKDLLLDLRRELMTGQDPSCFDEAEGDEFGLQSDLEKEAGDSEEVFRSGNDGYSAVLSLFSTPGEFNHSYCTKLFRRSGRRHDFFTSFETLNSRLQRHIPSQIEQPNVKKSPDQDKIAQLCLPPTKIWKNAKHLYSPLSERWTCHCRQLHQANLLLRTYDKNPDFQILFIYDETSSRDTRPWAWLEMTIQELDQPKPSQTALKSAKSPGAPDGDMGGNSPTQHNPQRVVPTQLAPETSAMTPPKAYPTRKKVSWTSKPQSSDHTGGSHTTQDQCICAILTKYTADNVPFKVSLHHEEYQYSASPASTAINCSSTLDKISLDKMLHAGPGEGLSRRQRFSTAHLIASSMFELHSTPWLESSWTKTDIVFFRDTTNPGGNMCERPYLRRHISPQSNEPSDGTRDLISESLGVLLLELCYGTRLEEFSIYKTFPIRPEKPNHSFRLRIATALCENVADEAGPEMQAAIKWCLKNRRSDIDEHKWRKEFFGVVVLPLYNYTQYLAGKFIASEGTTHYGDNTSGGLGIYGNPQFFGETIVGGSGAEMHIHHHYASTTAAA